MATTPTITSNTPLIPSRTRSTRIPSQSNSSIIEILNSIQKSVKKIESIVASGYSLQKKQVEQQRRQSLSNTRTKKERESENVKLVNPFKFLKGALPRTGFLDALKNFILYTFMGLAFTKLYPLLPKVLAIAKGVKPFAKFLENFVGAAFNNFVNAIDLGYKQYDKVRALAKQIGGEKYEKQFDELSSQLNKFLNLAIIVGLTVAGSGAVGGDGKKLPTRVTPRPGLGGPGGGSTRLSQYFSQTRAQEAVTRRYGFDAARFYQDKINKGLTPANALKAVRERFSSRAIPTGGLAGKGRTAGRIGSRGLGKIQQRAALKLLGKGGSKILGKIPIIGPIADFLISTLVFRERPDRAAAGAVGSAVGAALGSFPALIPFGGPIWGGLLGDIIGRSLFDAVAAVPNDKVQKKAKGGPITRGGRSIGGTKRKVAKIPKRFRRNKVQTPQPGKDIGGINVIRKIYRSPKKLKPGKINPLKTLEDISKIHSKNKDPLFGGIIAATSNLTIGQRPDPSLKQEIRNNFATLIDNAISAQSAKDAAQIGNSIIAAANGGMVQSPVTRTLKAGPTIGEKLGDLIATSFQRSLDMRTNEIFSSIRRKLGLKDDDLSSGASPDGTYDGGPDVFHGMGAERMWNFFKNKGLSDFAVAGIMGNARWESSFNPTARGIGMGPGGSDAIGIFQWGETERWKDLVNWATGQNLNPWDYDTQLKFAWHEMQTSEKATIPALQGATSAADAAEKFRSVYERSAHTEQRRKDAAEGFYKQYKGKTYIPPTTGVPLIETSQYGMRSGGMHNGIDLQARSGWKDTIHLPVTVKKEGIVEYVGYDGQDNGMVIIKHPDGSKTKYLHVNGFKVSTGDTIRSGQVIARIAGEGERGYGNSTGPHLHFEYVNKNGKSVNPKSIYSSYVSLGRSAAPVARPLSNPPATPPAAPGQNTPRQPAATPNQPIKNQGVTFKNGKFYKSGLFGLDQEIEVNNRTNVQLRQIPSFGLGRGTEGQLKKSKDGGYYRFINGNWVNIYEGGNASIQKVNPPSSTIAKFAPSENRQFQQVANNISKDDPTNMPQQDTIFALQKVYITA